MVAESDFTEDIQALAESLVQPNTYDLFIWIHHLVGKDNNLTKCKPAIYCSYYIYLRASGSADSAKPRAHGIVISNVDAFCRHR